MPCDAQIEEKTSKTFKVNVLIFLDVDAPVPDSFGVKNTTNQPVRYCIGCCDAMQYALKEQSKQSQSTGAALR